MDARNFDGAIAAFENAARLGSDAGRTRAETARQEKALQERRELAQQREVIQQRELIQQALVRARQLMDKGDYDEALRAISQALKVDSKNAEAIMLREKVLAAQAFEGKLG